MKSPIVLLSALLKSFSRLEPGVKGLDRDLETIKKRFENEGYGFLSIALPALGAALDKGLASGVFAAPIGFGCPKGRVIPKFLQGMLCEVFDPLSGHLKALPNTGVIKNLRQLLMCFKKISLSQEDNDLLDSKASTEFFQNDEFAGSVIFPDTEAHFLGVVCRMLLPTLSSKLVEFANYKHGPGAVFEGYKGNQKWVALVDVIKNDDIDVVSYGYDLFSTNLSDLSDRRIIHDSTERLYLKGGASRSIARLVTVPKNSTSRRTITVEPLRNQFVQQGLNALLRESILDCKVLRNSLALSDQSFNQKLALEGSLFDNWATIDLKSASDLLSVKLVELVFGHHGLFLDHMMDCRSSGVDSRFQSTTFLRKFAGMGNALTFPVQSICFAAVCISAILHSKGRKPSYWAVRRASRHVRCYGDDIIVDSRYAHLCVNWLEMFGLKVNHRKSFLEGNFKESCGVDAYMGVDVTPIYIRSRPDTTSAEPNTIAGLVSTSNQFWLNCYYEVSAEIAEEVESRLGKRLPLVSVNSGVLGWHTRLDSMEPTRWNHRLHMLETRAFALKSLKRRDRLDGYPALLKFFHTPRLKDGEEHLGHLVPLVSRTQGHLEKSSVRYNNRLVQRWVPTKVG